MKKIFLLLLALSLTICLFACGGTPCTHEDAGSDGTCDKCEKPTGDGPVEPPLDDLMLIENGEVNFKFILTSDSISNKVITAIRNIVSELEDLGFRRVQWVRAGTSSDEEQEIEILVGNVTNRAPEYDYNAYDLGN